MVSGEEEILKGGKEGVIDGSLFAELACHCPELQARR